MSATLEQIHHHLAVSTLPSRTDLKRRRDDRVHGPESTKAATVREIFRSYCLPLGQLSIRSIETRSSRISDDTDGASDARVEVTFVPPQWLSNTLLRCNFNNFHCTAHGHPPPLFSLTPITINQSRQLSAALFSCDVSQLKYLFQNGLARPTDMIIDPFYHDPVTLLEVCNSSLDQFRTIG
jgi:hypothetical protein